MKRIVHFLILAIGLPIAGMAQNINDDLYFIPSKDKKEAKKVVAKEVVTVRTESPAPTIIIKNSKGTVVRDVDAYNRRYSSKDNNFEITDDTVYITEEPYDGLDGEWVNGFEGSADDYEYATRIIRFRNPRFAISISSPYYWDIVYGLNSWDWNVYTDGFYAYAFPTFSNPYWWDWRFNSWGWGRPYYSSWGWPYYGGYYSFGWGGYYGGYWGGYWDYPYYGGGYHHHHHPPYYGGGGHYRPNVTYRRSNLAGVNTSSRRDVLTRPSRPGSISSGSSSSRGSSSVSRPSSNDRPTARPTTRPSGNNTISTRPAEADHSRSARRGGSSRIVNTRETGVNPGTSTGSERRTTVRRTTTSTSRTTVSRPSTSYSRPSSAVNSGGSQSSRSSVSSSPSRSTSSGSSSSYSSGSSRSTRSYSSGSSSSSSYSRSSSGSSRSSYSSSGSYTPQSSSSYSSSSSGSSRSSSSYSSGGGSSSSRSSGSSSSGSSSSTSRSSRR